ncbi:MAG: hypothetical protein LBJ63_02355 [Prevotellaceae bacterium]|jgi:uncharacterized membrane protein|nr:hypothetical protein [Prevotellaceae bacterium]
MEQITKNFKLIGGILIIISCLLPFGSVLGLISFSGFSLFNFGILSILAILVILGGAASLIYVDVTKKDIELAPKFKLSCVAKLAVLAGGVLAFLYILMTEGVGIGFGLILEILFALALFFEEKVVAILKK